MFSDGQIILLDKGTTGLGMFDELPFLNQGSECFSNHASVFCYTDGITELENDEGDFFGTDNLKSFIAEHINSGTLEEFHQKLIAYLDQYRGSRNYSDDVTILSLRALQ